VHYYLGLALATLGKLDEAVAAHRSAVRLDGEHAGEAIFALGELLRRLGRYDEAIETLHLAMDLARDEGRPDQAQRADRARERVGHMKAIVARPPALIGGEHASKDGDRGPTSTVLRYDKTQFGLAARFYADAFCALPGLARDLKAWHRYNAACYASLAAAARGAGVPNLDDNERSRLRKQALAWLRADLDAWTKLLTIGAPDSSEEVLETMKHWQQDSDLNGIRDEAALGELSPQERAAFAQLWADVAALLKNAMTAPDAGAKS
jgi:tetratricopeptide (TPR) repeat protein